MEPSRKKAKVDPVEEVVRNIRDLDLTKYSPPAKLFDDKLWLESYLKALKPGNGLIGNKDEETERFNALFDDDALPDHGIPPVVESLQNPAEEKGQEGGPVPESSKTALTKRPAPTAFEEPEEVVEPDLEVNGKAYTISEYFGVAWVDLIVSTCAQQSQVKASRLPCHSISCKMCRRWSVLRTRSRSLTHISSKVLPRRTLCAGVISEACSTATAWVLGRPYKVF